MIKNNFIPSFCIKIFIIFFSIISISGFSQEICNNGIDDDNDGLIDLNDIVDCACNSTSTIITSIIPNPSFEVMSSCPTNFDQLANATGWIPTCGSPDFMNTCGYMFPAVNSAGLIPFPDGNGIAGAAFLQDLKENIGCCLTTPLIAGTSYKITFAIASTPLKPDNGQLASGAILYDPIDITIYGSSNCPTLALNIISPCPTTTSPSWLTLGAKSYTPNITWQNMSIIFTPSVTINSIIIGAPCSLPVSYPLNSIPPPAYYPYFYFDNFILNNSVLFPAAIDITSNGHYCTNDITLTANLSGAITTNTVLQWYHNGIAIVGATSNTFMIPAGTTGLGNYQAMLTDGTNCVVSTKYIVSSSPPIISVNSSSICPASTATLSASSACNSYTWSTGAFTNSISVSPTVNSSYTVVGSLGTCTSQATGKVTIFSPTLSVTGNTLICLGNSTTLSASGASYYSWSDVLIPFTLNNYNSPIVISTPSATTTYTVHGLSGAGSNTCIAQAIVTVSIAPSPTITITPSNGFVCAGNTITLTASIIGANTYTWNTGEITSSISVSPLTDDYYFVYSNIGSCVSQSNATVNVIPSFSFSVNSPTICSGQTASLIASGANSYVWSNGSSNNSITTLPLYSNTIYTVTGSNGLTCSSATTTTVFVYHPTANYSGLNESFYTVESILQLTNQSSGAASYKWKLCDNEFSTNTNISLPVKDTGNCCITLIANINSCTDSITKCFKIVPESSISVPNVFTPNGDTKNDLFKVSSTGLKSLNCMIYDRWGLKMYEWDGINGSWDGNSKTGTAPDGTYFYIINYTDLRDKSVTEKGYLNLFK